jgi:hypothetical protein
VAVGTAGGTGLTAAYWFGFVDGLALFAVSLLLFLMWIYSSRERAELFHDGLAIVCGRTAPRKRKPPGGQTVQSGPSVVP